MSPNSDGESPASPETTRPPSERVEELEDRVDDLEATLQTLEHEIAELEQERDKRTDTLARLQADYENYRKRVQSEKQEAREEAYAELVDVLAGVLDDVQRALDAGPDDKVREGLQLLVRRVEDELGSLDVQRVEPDVGDSFDPQRHEALLTESTDEHEPDTVIELLQPGYRLGDRLVRAARVKVAKAPTASEAKA